MKQTFREFEATITNISYFNDEFNPQLPEHAAITLCIDDEAQQLKLIKTLHETCRYDSDWFDRLLVSIKAIMPFGKQFTQNLHPGDRVKAMLEFYTSHADKRFPPMLQARLYSITKLKEKDGND